MRTQAEVAVQLSRKRLETAAFLLWTSRELEDVTSILFSAAVDPSPPATQLPGSSVCLMLG